MSLFKKEKRNPSSRYSRIEEPWLDEEEAESGRGTEGGMPNGYGVPDSYTRQASYGHPDGYYAGDGYSRERYPQERYSQGRYAGERYSQGRYPEEDYRGYGDYDDYTGRDAYGGNDPCYSYGADSGQDSYDDRDPYYGRPGAEYEGSAGYEDDGPGIYDRRRYEEGNPEGDGAGRGRRKKRTASGQPKGRRGFLVKLILLVIAALALLLVWRFSRMKHVSLSDIITNSGMTKPTGYREFVIYGVDSREGNLTKDAHSDTIIVCSMNESTKEVRMVSVYRDTYLDNTNGEYRKATECYFFGGPSRAVNMLNKNLDLDLHDYITVDFNAVVKAVDLIGGVDVEVTEEELPYINGYQTENAAVTGAEITPVEYAGYQHLNGIQALAYCRIRYTEGSDYRRTERQRTVLSQIFSQAKSQGPVKMAQMVDTMLPYIATSFSSTELLSLATSITGSTLLDSVGFPFELQAANIPAGDCVVPVNLAQNVSELHAYLYQRSGYTPTQTVQEISQEIASSTGIY